MFRRHRGDVTGLVDVGTLYVLVLVHEIAATLAGGCPSAVAEAIDPKHQAFAGNTFKGVHAEMTLRVVPVHVRTVRVVTKCRNMKIGTERTLLDPKYYSHLLSRHDLELGRK